jgi:L-amino acid N-acyltransferase YncA
MSIREARESDFDAVADITNHYIVHTPIHFSYEPVSPDELRDAWRTGVGRYPFVVLEQDARVVGYAKAAMWRTRTAYDRTAEVGIYLHPALTGRGMGKPLYAALIAACRTAGMHSLVGGIALPNPPSVRLHESLGFVHVGTYREVGWKFEQWHDVTFYQLML